MYLHNAESTARYIDMQAQRFAQESDLQALVLFLPPAFRDEAVSLVLEMDKQPVVMVKIVDNTLLLVRDQTSGAATLQPLSPTLDADIASLCAEMAGAIAQRGGFEVIYTAELPQGFSPYDLLNFECAHRLMAVQYSGSRWSIVSNSKGADLVLY